MSVDSFEFLPLLGFGITVLLIQQSSFAYLLLEGCVSHAWIEGRHTVPKSSLLCTLGPTSSLTYSSL